MRTGIRHTRQVEAPEDRLWVDEGALAPLGEGPPGLSNAPEISVTDLSNALKRTVEERFGFVRLRGEISNYRGPHSSGHAYFCLKDAGARIDAVIWRTSLARLRIKPEEGMDVVATGKVTTFPGKSSYQIVIESLEPAGIGALMAMVEERRRRLAAEGLFDAARKKALPYLPASIGVVTSPTGAVIRDILHRIAGRFPRPVLVWPVRVQGDGSAAEIARAIAGFSALSDAGLIAPPRVVIVARGGGSLEDLWGFNDEAVVRAAAGSLIPLVSAVGHETDWTLLDHVADLRAPTPTGAAELAVPVRADLIAGVDRLAARHAGSALRLLERAREALRTSARVLPSGADLLAVPRQRLDRAGPQLPAALRLGADRRRLDVARLSGRLMAQSPQARMARAVQRVEGLGDRLDRARQVSSAVRQRQLDATAQRLRTGFAARLGSLVQQNRFAAERLAVLSARFGHAMTAASARRAAHLVSAAQMLAALGYRGVLARGFALVRGSDGDPVRTASQVGAGAELTLQFADGEVPVRAAGLADDDRLTARPRSRPSIKAIQPTRQGSLF